MVRCSVIGCENDSQRKIEGLSFHSFPKNKKYRKLWIKATGRKRWLPKKVSRLCSKHFCSCSFIRKPNNKTWLVAGAVPIKFVKNLDSIQAIAPFDRCLQHDEPNLEPRPRDNQERRINLRGRSLLDWLVEVGMVVDHFIHFPNVKDLFNTILRYLFLAPRH